MQFRATMLRVMIVSATVLLPLGLLASPAAAAPDIQQSEVCVTVLSKGEGGADSSIKFGSCSSDPQVIAQNR